MNFADKCCTNELEFTELVRTAKICNSLHSIQSLQTVW